MIYPRIDLFQSVLLLYFYPLRSPIHRRFTTVRDILKRGKKIQLLSNNPNPVSSFENEGNNTQQFSSILTQYERLRSQYKDHIVLMQVGDFFEAFNDTAHLLSKTLDIGICQKSRYDNAPLTGVPIRSIDAHLEKLVKCGYSVVLAEQQQPQPQPHSQSQSQSQQQFSKSEKIKRVITRVITPGTLTEESILNSKSNNYLLSISPKMSDNRFGFAWLDLSTGHFCMANTNESNSKTLLDKINPSEILFQRNAENLDELMVTTIKSKSTTKTTFIDSNPSINIYQEFYNEESLSDIDSKYTSEELLAGAQLLTYVLSTQPLNKPFINVPIRHDLSQTIKINDATCKSLELVRGITSGTRENSLLETIDYTITSAGSRLLQRWLLSPMKCISSINNRLDQIGQYIQNLDLIQSIREELKHCRDIERSFQRITLNRSNGGPKDMIAIKETLLHAMEIKKIFNQMSTIFKGISNSDFDFQSLTDKLEKALVEPCPSCPSDGNIIKAGFNDKLDTLRIGSGEFEHSKDVLLINYKMMTGKSSLKLINRKSLGWFVEVNVSEGTINQPTFVLTGQVDGKLRYRTAELEALNKSHIDRGIEILDLEMILYEELRQNIIAEGVKIMNIARILAEIDCLSSLALLALSNGYCRPNVCNDSILEIINGRHPVVETKLRLQGNMFTSNSCNFDQTHRLSIITGPNMGGKSTFLRQNALIVIMAQCGMYVPAEEAKIGVIDAIYTRIGANDDLANDRSTFMIEMIETAFIMNHATEKSLVIMDEVGRGTSSDEGFALAVGVAKYLELLGCRTLFATHYSSIGKHLDNRTLFLRTEAIQDKITGDLVFLHHVIPGIASHSHALDIAKLAGVPQKVLDLALDCLSNQKQP